MAHEWINNNSEGHYRIMENEKRKCSKCGAEQEFIGTGTWMRIGARRWEPLVGKCKGKISMEATTHENNKRTDNIKI